MTSSHNQSPIEASRFNTSRVDLSPYIRQIENGTFPIAPSLTSSILKKLTEGVLHLPGSAVHKMWDELKIERNALVAALSRTVMRNVRGQLSALRSAIEARLRNGTNTHDIPILSTVFLDELSAVAQNRHVETDDAKRAHTRTLVQRLDDIVLFGGRFGLWKNRQGLHTPQAFIFRGFNTATGFLVAYYQLLVKTYIQNDIPLTSETIEKGVKSALQHMHLFASFNLAHGPGLLDGLQNNAVVDPFEAFSEKYFTFDKERMRFTPKMDLIRGIRQPQANINVLESAPDGVTTGCPVSFTPTDFDELATHYAKVLGVYVDTMSEHDKEMPEMAVRNFLVRIT